eukprot:4817767-Amphidinium_carterae.1
MGKVVLFNWLTAGRKQQPPPRRSMIKCAICLLDMQNMPEGCSAGVIHVGTHIQTYPRWGMSHR